MVRSLWPYKEVCNVTFWSVLVDQIATTIPYGQWYGYPCVKHISNRKWYVTYGLIKKYTFWSELVDQTATTIWTMVVQAKQACLATSKHVHSLVMYS